MADRRTPPIRPETRAYAARGTARPASYGRMVEISIESELALTRVMASRLWRLLCERHPIVAAELDDAHTIDARAAYNRWFEASLMLLFRHNIDVVPCRKLLWAQDEQPTKFLLTRPSGDSEVIDEQQLMMLAGIAA
jgi:hypothetical protein